jgi:hypothetical protein
MPVERYELVCSREDEEIARVHADLDTADGDSLRAHLLAAVLRSGGREKDLGEYVLAVYRPVRGEPDFTYSAL